MVTRKVKFARAACIMLLLNMLVRRIKIGLEVGQTCWWGTGSGRLCLSDPHLWQLQGHLWTGKSCDDSVKNVPLSRIFLPTT